MSLINCHSLKRHFVTPAPVLYGCDIIVVMVVAWPKASAIVNCIAINSQAGSKVTTHSFHSSLFTAAAGC